MQPTTPKDSVPRIEYLRVRNYRALKDLELKNLTPFTVLLGPNGSGKSTVFDVFAFLSECFTEGLRKAWDRRGRFKELRTRGEEGPIVIEFKYREEPKKPVITYHLAIDEGDKGPYIVEEWLHWRRGSHGRPFRFLDFSNGHGLVITGGMPDEKDERAEEELTSSDLLAVNTLGQLAKHPRISALRRFIADWHLSKLNIDAARVSPEAGPQERLSKNGDNLPNVIQFLKEEHPHIFESIIAVLSQKIPRLEMVDAELMADGRLLLQFKDEPFDRPILAKYTSDGTLKLLSYLTLLFSPKPPQFIGIEEPENQLYPRLLSILSEEFIKASSHSQIIVTTHSSVFLNGLTPDQVWILYRNKKGFTEAICVKDVAGIKGFVDEDANLGDLWLEGYFNDNTTFGISVGE